LNAVSYSKNVKNNSDSTQLFVFGGAKNVGEKYFILGEQQYFVWDTASQSTKSLYILKIWEGIPWLRLCQEWLKACWTTQEFRMHLKYARKLSFLLCGCYMCNYYGKNRYGLVSAALMNSPELPTNDDSGVPRVSRARGQTQFWRPHPHPARPWQHTVDAKNELGIKGPRKLTQAMQSPAYNCF